MNEVLKQKISHAIRVVLILLACAVMLFFAVRATGNLYDKWDILKEMENNSEITSEYSPTNFGTYFGKTNLSVARAVWATQSATQPLNEISLFEKAYHEYVEEHKDELKLSGEQLRASKTDASYLFEMMMVGFAYDSTDARLKEINEKEEVFFQNCIGFIAATVVMLILFCLVDKKKPFNDFTPRTEKTTFGLPAYLSIVLCYLTLGLYGLLLFFCERKSRYVRQAAVQSMLIGLLTVAIYLTTSLMYTIFAYMFPPASILIFVIQLVLVGSSATFLAFALLMALINRAVKLPLVGQLAINSSHCDVV